MVGMVKYIKILNKTRPFLPFLLLHCLLPLTSLNPVFPFPFGFSLFLVGPPSSGLRGEQPWWMEGGREESCLDSLLSCFQQGPGTVSGLSGPGEGCHLGHSLESGN